jgi:DNA-binding NarL/FixJ family response regulator
MKKKISIIEDNSTLLNALTTAINSSEKYEVIQTFSSAEAAIAANSFQDTDFVIMDIQLEGKLTGIECTAFIKKNYPNVEILMLTVFEDSKQVFDALRAGACGYITKTANFDEIKSALDQAAMGGAPMSFKIARMVLSSFNKNTSSPLTAKEQEILELLSQGGSYKTAANKLDISVETVKYHIKNIYIKLQVNNKEDAIELARKNNWI